MLEQLSAVNKVINIGDKTKYFWQLANLQFVTQYTAILRVFAHSILVNLLTTLYDL